jgi:hypothetical protein
VLQASCPFPRTEGEGRYDAGRNDAGEMVKRTPWDDKRSTFGNPDQQPHQSRFREEKLQGCGVSISGSADLRLVVMSDGLPKTAQC